MPPVRVRRSSELTEGATPQTAGMRRMAAPVEQVIVGFRVGSGPVVVNVDGPEPG